MINQFNIESTYNTFLKTYTDLCKSNDRIVIFFYGALNEEGQSWCPDCRKVAPVIDSALEAAKEDPSVNVNYISVGIERVEWKNADNNFRKNEKLLLTNIPTLIYFEGKQEKGRLVEDQCENLQSVLSYLKP